MGIEELAAAHYRRQVTLARRAAEHLAGMWRRVSARDIAGSWRDQLVTAFTVVSSAQAIAAASSGVYVGDVVAEQGLPSDTEGRVNPARFAEVASDGRDLTSLLYQPAIAALTAIGQGADVTRALAAGGFELDMIVRTQVADAGRVADGVAITARRHVGGYVRMLNPPSCARCIILAGRWYRWNEGFQRHPRCDCRHIPVAEDTADDVRTEPRQAFESMSQTDQDRLFGRDGAQAIRDGADISKVVNARRGMQTASVFGRDVQLTTEGTTLRGDFGRARREGPLQQRPGQRIRSTAAVRLMPEQIYREAHGDRDEAIRLLRLHGYIL